MSSADGTRRESADEIEALAEQFRARLQEGQKPDRQAVVAAHPHLGNRLERRLAMIEMLHRLGLESQPDSSPIGEATVLDDAAPKAGPASRWPTDLPDYHIVGELGKGGMGVVYNAVQLSLNRTVALKMMRAGTHASPELLARFHIEAEALASLQHPNIVQVYEVGQHCGCPYMTMEFLDGGSLADLLGNQSQPPATAAHLVETLARAMHCAHLRGIVHRDLKPANILLVGDRGQGSGVNQVSRTAASPLTPDPWPLTPKITDFGLAKRLQETDKQTATGVIMGTPSYMAPEQAEGKSRRVGPPTDVYALGAILYEMLTGQPPFQGDTHLETIRKVVSEEPTAPKLLKPKVPRDLTTIAMKCLEKLPARRYASAEALADDLRRYLDGEPILARRAGMGERAWKWMKRHRAVTGIIGVCLATALLLAGVGLWSYAKVRDERDRALGDYRVAFEAVNHLYAKMAGERLLDEPNKDPLREELLERAPKVFEGFARQHSTDPQIRREIALAWFRLADIHRILDRADRAEAEYLEAIERQDELRGQHPDDPRCLRELAASHNWLGEMLRENRQRLRDAEPHFRAAFQLQERALQMLADTEPEKRACLMDVARSHYNLGIVQMDTRQPEAARRDDDRAVEVLTALHQADSEDANCRQDLARAYINRGILHKENGRPGEASADYQAAKEHLLWLTSHFDKRVVYRYDRAVLLHNEANLLANQKHYEAAGRAAQESLVLLNQLVADFSTRPRYKKKLANTLNSQGIALAQTGDRAAAAKCWKQARELLEPLLAQVPDPADYRAILGIALGNLGCLQADDKHWTEARQLLEPAMGHLQASLAPDLGRLDYLDALRNNAQSLAETLVQLGDHAAAVAAADVLAGVFPDQPREHYFAACFTARCVPVAQKDKNLGDAAARDATARRYAERAVAHLRAATAHVVTGLDRLEDEKQLFAPLEGHPGFAQAMRELDAKAKKPQ